MKTTLKYLLVSFVVLALLLVLGIIGTALYMMVTVKNPPQDLLSWSNISIGFIFGIVSNLVTNWSKFVFEKETVDDQKP